MNQFTIFIVNHWTLWLALVIVIALIVLEEAGGFFRNVKQISLSDAVNLMNHEHPTIVDIRTAENFNSGHIVHSINIPVADLVTNLKKIKHKEASLLIISDNEPHTIKASSVLEQNGFTKIYSLKGGISAWQREGFPLSKK